tara:strand:+ start:7793 stop:9163 length:1371 start_codon:yes stop_codon:yes gene_type:complete
MEPLPPAVIAGLTPKSIEIKFFDDRIEKIDYEDPTDFVAISIETYTAKRCYQIASEYRKRGVPVVMGGFHATLVPDEVAEYADVVVVGEAEEVWHKVLEDFKNGSLKNFYQSFGRADLSKTMPDRSIFKGKKYMNLGLVEAGRGCTFRCDFCAIQTFFESTHKRRPFENIIKEIKAIKKDMIFFVDDNLFSNPNEAKEFLKKLIPLKIRWVGQASINVAFDKEFLQLMKDSGCYGVLIGFETLDSQSLNSMNKGFNRMGGGFKQAIKNLYEYRIRLYPTFIFGYPHDSLDSFQKTVEFSKNQGFLIVAFNHLTPFPGTPLYRRLEEEGNLQYDKWWLDPLYQYGDCPIKGGNLTSEQIKENCIKSRQSFYSLPSIIKRSLNKTNCNNLFSLGLFYTMNLLFRKEVSIREGYPLGDAAYESELIKAKNAGEQTYASFVTENKVSERVGITEVVPHAR